MRYYFLKYEYNSSEEKLSRCMLHHIDYGLGQVVCARSKSSPYYWYDFYTNDLDYSYNYNVEMLERNSTCTIKLITRKEFDKLVEKERIFRELVQ